MRKPKRRPAQSTAIFSTRIPTDLRTALQRQADRNHRSLSREIIARLTASLNDTKRHGLDRQADHNKALAVLVGTFAGSLEMGTLVGPPSSGTTSSWRTDPYLWQALRTGIDVLLCKMTPAGEVTIPAALRAVMERSAAAGQQYQTPEGYGMAYALGLWDQLRILTRPPFDRPSNSHYADSYYTLPWVREKLGLNGEPS